MPEILQATFAPLQDGVRLDRALGELFPDQSRSALARLIEDGCVRIDEKTVTRSSQKVRAGQQVTVNLPDPAAATAVSQDLPLTILYQDDAIAVVDKPPALVVHPAAGHADGTLVNALLFHVGGLSGIGGEIRPGIVHRLDKDTSGVLIVAKNDAAHRALTANWNSELVRKEYLAVVYGTPREESGRVEGPIGRDPRDRKRMAVVQGGRDAATEYHLVERLRHASVVRFRLLTGRTHQIRVHAKQLGHPIVGDPVYSGPQWRGIPDRKLQRLIEAFPRQALHAWRITLPHPTTGETVTFESPLPADMRELIEALR